MTAKEFRRGLLNARPGWECFPAEQAEEILGRRPMGAGALGDALVDPQQIWERREGDGWRLLSYWNGAADAALRFRHQVLEALRGEQAGLFRKAQAVMDGAGATIEGCRSQIAAAEAALEQALADEKRDKATAKDIEQQARALDARVNEAQRDVDRQPAPAEAPVPA